MRRTGTRVYLTAAAAILLCGAPAFGAGILIEDMTSPFGQFAGIEYVIHSGRFVGSTSTGDYRVPYEIVVPADPQRGNGIIVVEPPHFAFRTAARDVLLGREFLLGQGFVHAAVGWSFNGNSILNPGAADVFIDGGVGGQDVEIIADFTHALRASPSALPPASVVRKVYAFGYSQTSTAVLALLYSPAGAGLFDFTLVVGVPAVGLPGVLPSPFSPPYLGGPIIAGLFEADLILFGGAAMRGDDELFPEYRSYEIAGMPHLPSGTGFGGVPQQDWRPLARALFAAGHDWEAEHVPPPASVAIRSSAPGEVDPVYGWPTGIERDDWGNAVGGVRPPDLDLGRGRFVAADFSNPIPIPGFSGGFIDLQCTEDFRESLPNHGRYVAAHERAVQSLLDQRFLLRADASVTHIRASRSDVGRSGSCP